MKEEDIKLHSARSNLLWIAAIIIIGFNLRPAITSVGPLLGMIRDDIGLSNWNAGLLTSLPLLAFAFMSPLAPKIGSRFGNTLAVPLGLFFLLVGIVTRSISTTVTLFAGTIVIGMGIAVMNVLLPAVIKEKFPHKVGRMTSLYTTSMKIFAATASGLSVPLARGVGGRWELSLGTWAILAIIGLFVWIPIMKKRAKTSENISEPQVGSIETKLFSSPLAWQVTFFMGLQSFIFYTVVSWLPEMLQDFGFTLETAGWLLFYVQIIGLPSTFLAPLIAERYSSQKGIVFVAGILILSGFVGLLIGGPLSLIVLWVTLIGIGTGATISLSLTLLSMRARTASQAGRLSGMAQSIGYLLAAIGPILIGLLYDLNGTWTIPFVLIILISLGMTICGLGAGRNKYVMEA